MSVKSARGESISGEQARRVDVPDAPTIGSATDVGTSRAYNNGSATVAFTAAATGGAVSTYTATSTPGSFTATGTSSPLTVTGLQSATSYTFTVKGTNVNSQDSALSSASNSITATTVPQAPTIGTVSVTNATTVSIPFTAGATGGSSITSYTTTSSPSISLTTTGTTTPLSVTGTFASGQAYTFTIAAVNANGTSTASSASNSVTPLNPAFESIATVTGTGSSSDIVFSNIPSTYKHLQIRYIAKSTTSSSASAYGVNILFNNSTTSYTRHGITASDSATDTPTPTSNDTNISIGDVILSSETSLNNMFSTGILDLYEYASTSKNKVLRGLMGYDSNNVLTNNYVNILTGMRKSTAAITSITLQLFTGNWTTTSTFALYGIKG